MIKTVLVAAGGTGGHIYPGLAIAETLRKRHPDWQIIFIGSKTGMEAKIIPDYGFSMDFIRVSGFDRGNPVKMLRAAIKMTSSRKDAKKLLKKYTPDLVIGTGGYTSGILLYLAGKAGIPTLIHEQNAFPGKANRLAASVVSCIALTFIEAKKYFGNAQTELCGNPVRDAFKHIDPVKCREQIGVSTNKRVILATGGSQGAASINKAMLKVSDAYKGDPNVEIYHLIGPKKYDEVFAEAVAIGIDQYDNIHMMDYSKKMDVLMGAADVLISRAGATTIAEMSSSGTPAVLVPYPYAAGDHQRFNAQAVVDAGAGIMIDDNHLTGDLLLATVNDMLADEKKLKTFKQNALAYAKPEAGEKIADIAESLIQ